MKIYLAGSITGLGYDEVVEKFENARDRLTHVGYEVIHPMLGKEALRNEVDLKPRDYNNPVSTNHAIVERDRWMVAQADIVFCNLLGATRVSIGSCMELAWGELQHKHIVLVMEKDNIHRHAFILEAADIIYETEEDAFRYLAHLAGFHQRKGYKDG